MAAQANSSTKVLLVRLLGVCVAAGLVVLLAVSQIEEPESAEPPTGAGSGGAEDPSGRADRIGRFALSQDVEVPADPDRVPFDVAGSVEAPWALDVQPDGTVAILRNGAPVVVSQLGFWGPDWAWAGADVAMQAESGGARAVTGRSPLLGLTMTARLVEDAPNALTYRYAFNVDRPLENVTGVGLTWKLLRDSPAFDGRPPEVEYRADGRGWRWEAAEGEQVEVVFGQALPGMYTRKDDPDLIHTMMLTGTVPAGTHTAVATVRIPTGGVITPAAATRYGPANPLEWPEALLDTRESPVDLGFLNHRPAGVHGFVNADGDEFLFDDGTPARFWGVTLSAHALFQPDEVIETHARRIAQFGFNLVRITQHDAMGWVKPTVIAQDGPTSQELNTEALDRLDYWVHCLKQEGVYVWLDLHANRQLRPGDAQSAFGVIEGFREIARRNGDVRGFCYFNQPVQWLMMKFNEDYVTHRNAYTGTPYVREPAVMGLLVTNDNDLQRSLQVMFPPQAAPHHYKQLQDQAMEFAIITKVSPAEVMRPWAPGAGRMYLADRTQQVMLEMVEPLRALGIVPPIIPTSYREGGSAWSLPALTLGDAMDAQVRAEPEMLDANAHYRPNYLAWVAAASVAGMPTTVSSWAVQPGAADRFTTPLYTASVASLQTWDALMFDTYSHQAFGHESEPPAAWADPAVMAMMPAAALLYRERHVRPARLTYALDLGREDLYNELTNPATGAAFRTLPEMHRFVVTLPNVAELDWDEVVVPPHEAIDFNRPDRDFIPLDQQYVQSDTGELVRDWVQGIHTVNTAMTQAASGWLGGVEVTLDDVQVIVDTPKAAVAVTALDNRPIRRSRRLLVTAVARARQESPGVLPYRSEPVTGRLTIDAPGGLVATALAGDGTSAGEAGAVYADGAYTLLLRDTPATHWYLLAPPGGNGTDPAGAPPGD